MDLNWILYRTGGAAIFQGFFLVKLNLTFVQHGKFQDTFVGLYVSFEFNYRYRYWIIMDLVFAATASIGARALVYRIS